MDWEIWPSSEPDSAWRSRESIGLSWVYQCVFYETSKLFNCLTYAAILCNIQLWNFVKLWPYGNELGQNCHGFDETCEHFRGAMSVWSEFSRLFCCSLRQLLRSLSCSLGSCCHGFRLHWNGGWTLQSLTSSWDHHLVANSWNFLQETMVVTPKIW